MDTLQAFEAFAAAAKPQSPLTGALLRAAAAELRSGASWGPRLGRAWSSRTWSDPWDPGRLFAAALHREVLRESEGPLAPYYASAGGSYEEGKAGALQRRLRQCLEEKGEAFWSELAWRRARWPSSRGARAWTQEAERRFLPSGMPFHLAELQAGAGRNLLGGGPAGDLAGRRLGLERSPAAADEDELLWARASSPGDAPEAASEAEAAFEQLRQERTGGRLRMVEASAEEAPSLLASYLEERPGTGLLVFCAGAAIGPGPARMRFERALDRLLAPWGERARWVEAAPSRKGYTLYGRAAEGRPERIEYWTVWGEPAAAPAASEEEA